MSEFIALLCPTCGAKLTIAERATIVTCTYCGNGHTINRQNGNVHLETMLHDMQSGMNKTAAELAINRLTNELAVARTEEAAAKEALAKFEAENTLAAPPVKSSTISTTEVVLIIWIVFSIFGSAVMYSASLPPALCGSLALVFLVVYWSVRSGRLTRERRTYETQFQAYTGTAQMHTESLQKKREFANVKSKHAQDIQRSLERNRQIANS